jgi:Rrf2 family transcriptional regulator, cysteine metabolism repressor
MALMQISRKIDYALRAAIHLAARTDGRPASVAEIAACERVPKKFLEKIIQDLIHHGLVRSTRGAQGGYTLARAPGMVTFRDVIEAIEGPVSVNVCVGESGEAHDCSVFPNCRMLWVWKEAQKRVIDLFTTTTLADARWPAVAGASGDGAGSPGEYAPRSSV